MRIVIRPSMAPQREMDVTRAVVAAVAHELWRQFGGNEVVNWLEAERQVARALSGDRSPPGRAAEPAPEKPAGRGRGAVRTTTLRPPLQELAAPGAVGA
jgi:hypothetical protein